MLETKQPIPEKVQKSSTNKQFFAFISNEKKPYFVIVVEFFAPKVKTLNISSGTSSYLVKGESLTIKYLGGKNMTTPKTKQIEVKDVKGSSFKGMLRHSCMAICEEIGVEVCHTTDRLTDKEKNSILPTGFHPSGWCDERIQKIEKLKKHRKTEGNNAESKKQKVMKKEKGEKQALFETFTNVTQPCLIQRLFGSKHIAGKVPIKIKPLIRETDLNKKLIYPTREEILKDYQFAHFATDERNVMTYKKRPIQNFSEQYFWGRIEAELTVTDLDLEELALILNALKILKRLGSGYNSGSGHIRVDKISLYERTKKRSEVWTDASVEFVDEIVDRPRADLMKKALQEWTKKYSE